jgi:hypothetical protein
MSGPSAPHVLAVFAGRDFVPPACKRMERRQGDGADRRRVAVLVVDDVAVGVTHPKHLSVGGFEDRIARPNANAAPYGRAASVRRRLKP